MQVQENQGNPIIDFNSSDHPTIVQGPTSERHTNPLNTDVKETNIHNRDISQKSKFAKRVDILIDAELPAKAKSLIDALNNFVKNSDDQTHLDSFQKEAKNYFLNFSWSDEIQQKTEVHALSLRGGIKEAEMADSHKKLFEHILEISENNNEFIKEIILTTISNAVVNRTISQVTSDSTCENIKVEQVTRDLFIEANKFSPKEYPKEYYYFYTVEDGKIVFAKIFDAQEAKKEGPSESGNTFKELIFIFLLILAYLSVDLIDTFRKNVLSYP